MRVLECGVRWAVEARSKGRGDEQEQRRQVEQEQRRQEEQKQRRKSKNKGGRNKARKCVIQRRRERRAQTSRR